MACVLFLEDDHQGAAAREISPVDDTSGASSGLWGAFVGAVDGLIRRFQPPPGMLHSELLLLSPTGEAHHFSTYIGDQANWRTDDETYYRARQWRAMPIDGGGAVGTLAQACDVAIGTPYSLLRYPLSTRAFGWLAGVFSDASRAPAHCAALTARLLRFSLGTHGEKLLPAPSPRYSPSDLYNSIAANAWATEFDPVVATQQEVDDLAVLSTGTDEQVQQLGQLRRAKAAKAMAATIRATMLLDGPQTDPSVLRQFGWVLVRVADAYRRDPQGAV